MQLLLLTISVIAFCVFLLSFNIIFKKNGKFPESEIGKNKELRKLGLMCAKSQEKILWKKKSVNKVSLKYTPDSECESCSCCSCD
jgi:hypothetical protein